MKNEKWLNDWLEEIDSHTPPLDKNVLDEPIPRVESPARRSVVELLFGTPMKKALCALCSLALVVALVLLLIPSSTADPQYTVYTVDVNPSVVFLCDEGGRVTKIISENKDADLVISYGDFLESNIGRDVSDACVAFVDTVARLGFVELDSGDAVRVRTTAKESNVGSALCNYFMQKGASVAVLDEYMSEQSFSGWLDGFEGGELSELVEFLNDREITAEGRELDGLDAAALAEKYEREVVNGSLKQAMLSMIENNVDRMKEKQRLLLLINEANEKIKSSKDNPLNGTLSHLLIPAEYWDVIAEDEADYGEDFGLLMQNMEMLLAEYEQSLGRPLSGKAEFESLFSLYSEDYLIDILESVADGVSDYEYSLFYDVMIELLASLGYEVDWPEQSAAPPATKEEYISGIEGVMRAVQGERIRLARESYEAQRTPISEQDYNEYIGSIIEEYGSLDEYFKFLGK